MSAHHTNSAYRQASVNGATHAGLLTVVYDALAADLRDAGDAALGKNIRRRCTSSNHAMLLLGHLETWADCLDDPPLTANLRKFYGFLRVRVLELQHHGTLEDFYNLSGLVLEVRSTWQQKSEQASRTSNVPTLAASSAEGTAPQAPNRSLWCA